MRKIESMELDSPSQKANVTAEMVKNSADEVIDLRQYFAVINKHKWRIALLAIVITLTTVFAVTKVTPIYRQQLPY